MKHNQHQTLIIATDIYGLTGHTDRIAKLFSSHFKFIFTIDPYKGNRLKFQNDDQAYECYLKHCGIDYYTQRLVHLAKACEQTVSFLGFSAGASAVWRAVNALDSRRTHKSVCFYGTQIRNYTDLEQETPVTLIFPKREKTFDLEQVKNELRGKENLDIIETEYEHGFMNRCSENFNEEAYNIFTERLPEMLT